MHEIREIYRRWLDGTLAQEDALFAIGDVLQGTPAAEGPSAVCAEPLGVSGAQPKSKQRA